MLCVVEVETTMDIYSHVTEKVKKEVADKLNKGIFEALDIYVYQEPFNIVFNRGKC